MHKLSVPLEAQRKNSTCWHAAALMIWHYSQTKSGRIGPMNSLSEKWMRNEAITPQQFINLATRVGLMALPINSSNQTVSSLEALLRIWGPIWCAGYWYGPGHVIVLTGVDSGLVHLNDPDGGKPKIEKVSWFNEKLANQFVGCMMVKDPARY